MKSIVVNECYESVQIGVDNKNMLSESEAEELFKYIEDNNLDRDCIVWGRHSVTFINYVGYIQLSTCSIEILPKVRTSDMNESRKVLIKMLEKSGVIDVDYSSLSALKLINKNLFEVFSYLFAQKLKKEILKGKSSNYILKDENLQTLKGKLVVNDHVKNMVYKNSMAFCEYEEFSSNILLNQIFKRTINVLINRVKSLESIKLLKFSLLNFSEVDDRLVTVNDLNRVRFDRTNKRFYESFLLAKMFLANSVSITSAGREKGFSILFKMEELFEKYISCLMMQNIDLEVLTQQSKYKLLINEETNKGIYNLKPDIVIKVDGKEKLIIDTKWKNINSSYNRHGVKREDFFQMYAYLTRYKEADNVILLYPHNDCIEKDSGEYLESWRLEDNRDKRIRVYSVNYEDEERGVRDIKNILGDNINEYSSYNH